jgi:hypothetical protein
MYTEGYTTGDFFEKILRFYFNAVIIILLITKYNLEQ